MTSTYPWIQEIGLERNCLHAHLRRNDRSINLSPRSISNLLILLESSWNATRFNFFNCHVTSGKSGHAWIVSIHSLNCHLTGSKSDRQCLKFIKFQNDWISIGTLWTPVNRNRQISKRRRIFGRHPIPPYIKFEKKNSTHPLPPGMEIYTPIS